MKVSVIIPTYNEEKVIVNCLESLSKQTYEDFEIVIVDDGSKDSSKLKVKNAKLQFKIKNLKLLSQRHSGPGVARNLGARHAGGEILVFVDSDMTFEKDFIKELVRPIEQGKVKGTFSKEEYVSNTDNVWSKCWGINEGWEEGKRHPRDYPDKQKVFRAILKSEFDRVGGFSLTGYTDDWTLSDKLGYKAVNVGGAKFYHANPDTLKEVFVQAKWIGKRQYKLGIFGRLIAVVRASLPISIAIGGVKSLLYKEPRFFVFKIIYDFGIFCGALMIIWGGTRAK